jgi:hypothetical protein
MSNPTSAQQQFEECQKRSHKMANQRSTLGGRTLIINPAWKGNGNYKYKSNDNYKYYRRRRQLQKTNTTTTTNTTTDTTTTTTTTTTNTTSSAGTIPEMYKTIADEKTANRIKSSKHTRSKTRICENTTNHKLEQTEFDT